MNAAAIFEFYLTPQDVLFFNPFGDYLRDSVFSSCFSYFFYLSKFYWLFCTISNYVPIADTIHLFSNFLLYSVPFFGSPRYSWMQMLWIIETVVSINFRVQIIWNKKFNSLKLIQFIKQLWFLIEFFNARRCYLSF